jgi:hypothetical protein
MNTLEKNLTEEEILNSLENTLSMYKTKSFESITKNSLEKAKPTKRKSKKSKKTDEVFVKSEKSKVIKNKNRNTGRGSIRRKIWEKFSKSPNFVYDQIHLYRREIFTGALGLVMVSLISYTTYTTYAFMSISNTDIVGKVSEHVVLPVDETPKVYIVQSEKSEIFQNPLFKGIALGDNVLSYEKSGKVIIYRSKEDKIVNIVSTGN